MATKSIKQQIIHELENEGYQFDLSYRGKYRKMVYRFEDGSIDESRAPIFVGKLGGFRRGHSLADSISITDQLRGELRLPMYGDNRECELCEHTTVHEHKKARGCGVCGCKAYTGLVGWFPIVTAASEEEGAELN